MNQHEKNIINSPSICIVCEMKLEHQPTRVSREYQNEVYSFCSEECAEKFLKNPESFIEDEEDLE